VLCSPHNAFSMERLITGSGSFLWNAEDPEERVNTLRNGGATGITLVRTLYV